jgi:hypothetical protein
VPKHSEIQKATTHDSRNRVIPSSCGGVGGEARWEGEFANLQKLIAFPTVQYRKRGGPSSDGRGAGYPCGMGRARDYRRRNGAGGGSRTPTDRGPQDFKSRASTSFATPARKQSWIGNTRSSASQDVVRESLKIECAVVAVSRQSSAWKKGQWRAIERRRKRSEVRNQMRSRF